MGNGRKPSPNTIVLIPKSYTKQYLRGVHPELIAKSGSKTERRVKLSSERSDRYIATSLEQEPKRECTLQYNLFEPIMKAPSGPRGRPEGGKSEPFMGATVYFSSPS